MLPAGRTRDEVGAMCRRLSRVVGRLYFSSCKPRPVPHNCSMPHKQAVSIIKERSIVKLA